MMTRLAGWLAFAAAICLTGAVTSAKATTITYDFTGPTSGTNVDLGQTETYTASGGPNITATAGTFSGSTPAANGSTFSASSVIDLVGNNRGADAQGVGVCGTSSGDCTDVSNGMMAFRHQIQNHGEIDFSSKEVIQLDITSLFATFGSFQINADSATSGELLGIFTSNSATSIGTKLTDITSAQNNVGIIPIGNFLYFVSDSSSGSAAVLLHSLTVTTVDPPSVPEPTSLVLLGAGLLGFGWIRRRKVP
jgi:hypothetical protein